MLVNNPLCQGLPGRLIVNVVNEWGLRRTRHIVNNDVRLRGVALEKIRKLV
jgi:hypothetical protein